MVAAPDRQRQSTVPKTELGISFPNYRRPPCLDHDRKRETFLFYTDRKATEIQTLSQLSKFMSSDKQVFCIFKMDDWQDAEKLHDKMHIVALKGNKLIASNKKPYEN